MNNILTYGKPAAMLPEFYERCEGCEKLVHESKICVVDGKFFCAACIAEVMQLGTEAPEDGTTLDEEDDMEQARRLR